MGVEACHLREGCELAVWLMIDRKVEEFGCICCRRMGNGRLGTVEVRNESEHMNTAGRLK